ncbi:MAG TPA: hypothetical protein VEG30_09320 [Terriglobales bacterium]|nr:hypothetical protein [Terriglobales bacterium]
MPVVFVTLASFIFFILVIVALGIAHLAEKRESRHLCLQLSDKPFSVLSVAHAFEEDSAILWESQVCALQTTAAAGTRGIALVRFRRLYIELASRYPELYDGSSFEQWVHFLESAELISCIDYKVVITRQGQQFLKYRIVPKPVVAA